MVITEKLDGKDGDNDKKKDEKNGALNVSIITEKDDVEPLLDLKRNAIGQKITSIYPP